MKKLTEREKPQAWWVRVLVWVLDLAWRRRKPPTPLVVISASVEWNVRQNALAEAARVAEAFLDAPDPGLVDAATGAREIAAAIRRLLVDGPVLASNPLEADRVPSYYELATMYRDLWAELVRQRELMRTREDRLVTTINGWQAEVKKLHARCAKEESDAAVMRQALERFEPGWGEGVVETEEERESLRQEGLEAALALDAGKTFLAQLWAANDHSEMYREAWTALGASDCGLLKWRAVLDEIEAVREERDQLKAGSAVSPPSGWGAPDAALTELQRAGLLERTPEGIRIVGGVPSASPPSSLTEGGPAIVMDPRVFGGKPSLRGARIAVEHVLGMLAAGDSVDDLIKAYPNLDRADVLACVRYAHQLASGLIPLVPEWWRVAVTEERGRCSRIARAIGRESSCQGWGEAASLIASEIENPRRDDGVPRVEPSGRCPMPSNQCGTGDHPDCRLLDCGCDCHPPTKWNGREHEIQAGGAA